MNNNNSKQLYFSDLNKEIALPISSIITNMKENNLTECKISKAIRETNTDYFFCKHNQTVGVKDKGYEPCGNLCENYSPRNNKSGCCKHRGYCYDPSDEIYILNINDKIKITKKQNNNIFDVITNLEIPRGVRVSDYTYNNIVKTFHS